MGATSLTITEGDSPRVVRIKSTFPPAVICATPPDCSLGIRTSMPVVDSDIRCPKSSAIVPQAVLQWLSDTKQECGLVLTNTNWYAQHALLVRATTDGKKDGDQIRDMVLSATVSSNVSVVIGAIKVLFFFKKK